MTNDFGTDFADDITDVFVDGTNITAQATYYVTLYDQLGNELNGSLQNGRVAVGNAGWTETNSNAFENANEINFGENTSGSTIDVSEFAIKDSDAADGTAIEYFRASINNGPQNFADGTRVFFEAGDLYVDILD